MVRTGTHRQKRERAGVAFPRCKCIREFQLRILQKRGDHPGLVHILSAMESCSTYKPWHDKKTGETYLKPDHGRCLHYYFYFMDEKLGLCYVRVPTWCPFRLQIYFNGHGWLAAQLRQRGIEFTLIENGFCAIADWTEAQRLGRRVDGGSLARDSGQVRSELLPRHATLRGRISLELHAVRVCHRHRFLPAE